MDKLLLTYKVVDQVWVQELIQKKLELKELGFKKLFNKYHQKLNLN